MSADERGSDSAGSHSADSSSVGGSGPAHAAPPRQVVFGTAASIQAAVQAGREQRPLPEPAPAPVVPELPPIAPTPLPHLANESIDGPTRAISRPKQVEELPDLSQVVPPAPVRVAEPVTVAKAETATAGPLRARVQLRHIDPWSTLKMSFVISGVMFLVWMVAVGILYMVLDGMGVWNRLNTAFTDIVSENSSGGLITAGDIFGFSAGIGIMGVILFTALTTVAAFIYNQCAELVGGIQVTLADPD